MVNFRKLADRATKAREIVDKQVEKQGGSEALKAKADRIRDVAKREGTMGERAKAAAAIAREKPTPAAPAPADEPPPTPAAAPAKPANPEQAADPLKPSAPARPAAGANPPADG